MYDILKFKIGTAPLPALNALLPTNTADAQDLWLFTDPAAKALYQQQNRLTELQDDIVAYVIYEEQWADDEVALKR